MADQAVIAINGVWKIFGDRAEEAMEAIKSRGLSKGQVLEEFGCVVGIADCSFSVNRGEVFCVMGLSGSGKSTLVRHLNRLIEPTAGEISVLDRDIRALRSEELREMRARHIGMVFQHMALLPHRTVRDNVAFPLQIRNEPKSKAMGGLATGSDHGQPGGLRRPFSKRIVRGDAAACRARSGSCV